MKHFDKHMKYVRQRADGRKHSFLMSSVAFIALIFAVMAVFVLFADTAAAAQSIIDVSGMGSLAMCAMVSIGSVSDSDTSGNAIGDRVYIIPVDDVDDSVPFPKVNANREVATIPMQAGKYMHSFMAKTTPTFVSSGSKEANAITVNGTNTFTIVVGGNHDILKDFIEDYIGKKFIVIFKTCETGIMEGIGNACKGVVFSGYEFKNDSDARAATLTFTQSTIQLPWTYIGAIVRQDPEVIAAGTATLALVSGNDRYIVSDGGASTYAINAAAGFSAADTGRVITLIGDGAANAATVEDSSSIMLINGATWTAKKGSLLNLRVFDAAVLMEVSRV